MVLYDIMRLGMFSGTIFVCSAQGITSGVVTRPEVYDGPPLLLTLHLQQ